MNKKGRREEERSDIPLLCHLLISKRRKNILQIDCLSLIPFIFHLCRAIFQKNLAWGNGRCHKIEGYSTKWENCEENGKRGRRKMGKKYKKRGWAKLRWKYERRGGNENKGERGERERERRLSFKLQYFQLIVYKIKSFKKKKKNWARLWIIMIKDDNDK